MVGPILITGATGFVGSCLMRSLVQDGYDVHIFSRKDSNKWRIDDLLKDVADYSVDLRDLVSVEQTVDNIKPSVIFHLATYGGFASQNNIAEIVDSNLMGTINLVNACAKVGFECFVNTGSSSEYGTKHEPMKEHDLLEPVGTYGVSKAATTLYCRSVAIEKNLPIITHRLFSPYGPWDDPKRLIPYLISSFLRGKNPNLSVPTSVRDFVYIDDVIEAYMKIANKPSNKSLIYNIGSGEQYTIGQIVELLADITGHNVTPTWRAVNKQRPEPEVWLADIDNAKRYLDWSPKTTLRSGLEKTVDWFRTNLDLYRYD